MYREEMQRSVAFVSTGSSDYEGFLRSTDMQLKLTLVTPETTSRIYDLSQRTNQVNISGTRYERRAVEEMAGEPGSKLPIVMQCQDRFGDYGIIGFALFEPDAGVVEDYFMSCRVQRKLVENAFFSHLLGIVKARGGASLRCRYRRTERNKLALTLLCDLGFEFIETEPGVGWLEHGLELIPGFDIVHVTAEFDSMSTKEVTE
jgi:FkbH-like protein